MDYWLKKGIFDGPGVYTFGMLGINVDADGRFRLKPIAGISRFLFLRAAL
jgi:hypothetical protein